MYTQVKYIQSFLHTDALYVYEHIRTGHMKTIIYTYRNICVYESLHAHVRVFTCVYMYMHIYIQKHMCVYTCVHTYVRVYMYMHVCRYICTQIHT
jgi:hypothetical protein